MEIVIVLFNIKLMIQTIAYVDQTGNSNIVDMLSQVDDGNIKCYQPIR